MRAAVVRVVLVVLFFGLLPAGAARADDAPAVSGSAQRIPDGATLIGTPNGPASKSLSDQLMSVHKHSDRRAWMESIASAIERLGGEDAVSGGLGVPPLSAESSASDEADVIIEPIDFKGVYIETAGAGDLDGDGSDDVVALIANYDTDTLTTEARRGADGAVLWSTTTGMDGVVAYPIGADMTGDGRPDLFQLGLDILSEDYGDCEDFECDRYEYSATFRWTAGIVSGATGTQGWARTYDGNISEVEEYSYNSDSVVVEEFAVTYDVEGVNVDLLAFDFDGNADGASELLVQTLDVTAHQTYNDTYVGTPVSDAGRVQEEYSLDSTTRADVLNGSGAVAKTLTEASEGSLALLWPAGDVTAPAGDDFIWERNVVPDYTADCVYAYVWVEVAEEYRSVCIDEPETESLELTVVNGQSFAEGWSRTFPMWGFFFPVGGDLNADGTDDLAVYLDDWETWGTTFASGATGADLWSVEGDPWPMVAAQINGSGGDDVVLVSANWDPETWNFEELVLSRRDGATGAELFSTTHSYPAPDGADYVETWGYAGSAPDADGDGVPDLYSGVVHYTYDESEEDEVVTSAASAESTARNGHELLAMAEDSGASLSLSADHSGDGLADAVVERYTEDTASMQVIRVSDGQSLWTDTTEGEYVFYGLAGDLNGDGSEDFLRHVWDELFTDRALHIASAVTTLDGRTGTPGWSLKGP